MKYIIETQTENVFNSCLDQSTTTVQLYEIDGTSVVLKAKEYDSSLGAGSAEASKAKFKVLAKGKVVSLSKKYGKLFFKGHYDVFIDFTERAVLTDGAQSVSYSFQFPSEEKERLSAAFKSADKTFSRLFAETEGREIQFDFPDAVSERLLQGKSSVRSFTIGSSEKGLGMKIQYYDEQKRILFYVLNPNKNSVWRGDLVFGKTSYFTVYFHSLDPVQNQKFKKIADARVQ